ncbi:MAG: hypothetical protein ACXWRZ_05380 [Bdellovibrio sp.]
MKSSHLTQAPAFVPSGCRAGVASCYAGDCVGGKALQDYAH